MSEIYLTKIERKTIFTKSLIFVLVMFGISDLTITGPFWFNFIPWLYILGTLGSLKNIDSTLMCIIGTFTVFVASLIMSGGLWGVTMISVFVSLVSLVFGVLTGKLLYQFVLEHRLVKYIKRSKKVIYISSALLMFVISFTFVGLHDGNLVTYLISKANLNTYIEDTYETKEFDIISTRYNRQVAGKYVYVVELEGQEVYFVPVSKEIFKDVNKSQRLEALNLKLKKETSSKVHDVLNKYPLLKEASVKYSLEYTKHAILPDTAILSIECVGDYANMSDLYVKLAECINELLSLKQADRVDISINKQSLKISKQNIPNITAEYIKGGFDIEVISD